jgi:multidrug efflux pump
VALTDLLETLQIYLGSTYVNDFSRFGRTYQVIAQADGVFRDQVEQIVRLETRNAAGQLVPIGSFVDVGRTYGPDPVGRYNGFPAADLVGQADPTKLSSAEAIATVTRLAPFVLPTGFGLEWTDLSYQQVTEGGANLVVFPIAILLVFLVFAALYESWILPLAILLIVPLCLLAALTGVWLAGGDRNVFVQIGLVVLTGLATKNAILISVLLLSQNPWMREIKLKSPRPLRLRSELCYGMPQHARTSSPTTMLAAFAANDTASARHHRTPYARSSAASTR